MDPRLQGPGTDHVPILTLVELPVDTAPVVPSCDFRMTDRGEFREELESQLSELPLPGILTEKTSLFSVIDHLTEAIQVAIHTKVPITQPSPHSKCWWNKEISMLKRQKNQLSNASYKYHTISDHPTHEEHRKVRNLYANEIHLAKKAHWVDFLEGMAGGDIWIANRYISGEAKDGGKTRIPTLKLSPPAGSDAPTVEVASNEDKSTMLARLE